MHDDHSYHPVFLHDSGDSVSSAAPASVRAMARGGNVTGVAVEEGLCPSLSHIKSPRTALPRMPSSLPDSSAVLRLDGPSSLKQNATLRLAAETATLHTNELSVPKNAPSIMAERRIAADQVLLDLDEMRANPP